MAIFPGARKGGAVTEQIRSLQGVVNKLMQNKSNYSGDVTLTPSSATTVISFAPNVLTSSTTIFLFPTTANASAAFAGVYRSAIDATNGTITLTHANDANADKTFHYVIQG